MTKTQKALKWMLDTAADQSHGYSQQNRWGKDYDCSSAVITAWQRAGVPVKDKGATYTGNMYDVFLKCGFKDVTKKVTLSTGKGLQPGDVLLNFVHHTAMYQGSGKIVHARGQSYGSPRTGDQGQEFAANCPYYNYPWDAILRYPESGSTPSPAKPKEKYLGTCAVTLAELGPGCYGQQVKTLQILLKAKGYKGADGKALDCDGEYGDNTAYAVEQLQKKAGMKNIWYGTVSSATWSLVLK